MPPPIHAGGLRYHGIGPLISAGIVEGLIKPRAMHQTKCYEAAVMWARTEGFIPAPETSHAIAAAIDEANRAREEGKEKVILFCWSGHGLMDLVGYDKYFQGQLTDYSLPQTDIDRWVGKISEFPKPEVRKTGKW
jgi:tryptophan synthase beta chain